MLESLSMAGSRKIPELNLELQSSLAQFSCFAFFIKLRQNEKYRAPAGNNHLSFFGGGWVEAEFFPLPSAVPVFLTQCSFKLQSELHLACSESM